MFIFFSYFMVNMTSKHMFISKTWTILHRIISYNIVIERSLQKVIFLRLSKLNTMNSNCTQTRPITLQLLFALNVYVDVLAHNLLHLKRPLFTRIIHTATLNILPCISLKKSALITM